MSTDNNKKGIDELKIIKLNSLLRAISQVNQLIVRFKDNIKFFQSICDILAECGLFSLVWIGTKEEDSYNIQLAAKAGEAVGYLDGLKVTWDESITGQGPTGVAIKTRIPQVIQDFSKHVEFKFWLEKANEYKLFSSMALPLVVDDQVVGVLNVYANQPNAFGTEEMNLLREVTDDINYGLQNRSIARRLEESEKRYKILAEAAHDMIYIIGHDLKVEYVNSFASRYLGKGVENIIGADHDSLFPKETAERQRTGIEKVLKTGESHYTEAENRINDRVVWLGTWLCPILDEQGHPVSVLGISRDITAQKNDQEQIKENEKTYHNIVNLSPDGMIVHSQGKIVYINNAALKIFGGTKEGDLLGKPVMNFVHLISQEIVKKRIVEMTKTKTSAPFLEEKFVKLDGSLIDVEVGSVPIIFKGQPAFQVLIRDLSERKQREMIEEHHIEELEKLNKFLVGREIRIKDLKKEVEELKKELNKE